MSWLVRSLGLATSDKEAIIYTHHQLMICPGTGDLCMVLAKLLLPLIDHPNHQADSYGHNQNGQQVPAVSTHPSGTPHAAIHHGSILRQGVTCG